MPNCDYYGDIHDHYNLLNAIFLDNSCIVFELYSEFGEEIRKFAGVEQVMGEFDRIYSNGKLRHGVNLQLYVNGSGPLPTPRRIDLNPTKCNGYTYRYSMEGWGLVQLYLEIENDGALRNSHTNHNTITRATKMAAMAGGVDSVGDWDFGVIEKYSCRLNRKIRSLAIGKMRNRPVLPGAFDKLRRGISLIPFQAGDFVPNGKFA